MQWSCLLYTGEMARETKGTGNVKMLPNCSESGMVPYKGSKCDMRRFTIGEELRVDLSHNNGMEPVLKQPCQQLQRGC